NSTANAEGSASDAWMMPASLRIVMVCMFPVRRSRPNASADSPFQDCFCSVVDLATRRPLLL
ncbi:MAG: hypothetical protein WAL22_06210, partial [Solirubrobacteraceae bacterium]